MVKFLFPGSPKYKGARIFCFDHPSYTQPIYFSFPKHITIKMLQGTTMCFFFYFQSRQISDVDEETVFKISYGIKFNLVKLIVLKRGPNATVKVYDVKLLVCAELKGNGFHTYS